MFRNLAPPGDCFSRIMSVLEGILVTLWGAWGHPAMHSVYAFDQKGAVQLLRASGEKTTRQLGRTEHEPASANSASITLMCMAASRARDYVTTRGTLDKAPPQPPSSSR
jgi:hypothetical protein